MPQISSKLNTLIKQALKDLSIQIDDIHLEHPAEIEHGDFSTNVALALAKTEKKNPRELAKDIAAKIASYQDETIERVETAGAGFVNFFLSRSFYTRVIESGLQAPERIGHTEALRNKKVLIEYTDPNAFKVFHIGHLMANAIGESVARTLEFSGASLVRLCYPSDIGLHIAKAIWGMKKNEHDSPKETDSLTAKTNFLGTAYVLGTKMYEEDPVVKEEINGLNKKLFEKSDPAVNRLYEKGREWSLDHFEELYKKLGTKFDRYIFESEVADKGSLIVEEYLGRGCFEKSEGAIVFKGEEHGLHTRVFITAKGLPTYESKEIGLNFKKFELYPCTDSSIIITGNEQNEYFKVLKRVLSIIAPNIGEKTHHVSHGMMRFADGKMSSRTGNVVTAEHLLSAVEALVHQKIADRELVDNEKNKIADIVAVGAIKFSILRQAIGGDIIYDFDKSISFEGDSGPYLQYSYTRARSVIEKAKGVGMKTHLETKSPSLNVEVYVLEKWLYRFPEVVTRAGQEFAPHYLATYLLELSSAFNAFYAEHKIVDLDDSEAPYRLALTEVFAATMKNGLYLLGIKAPERM